MYLPVEKNSKLKKGSGQQTIIKQQSKNLYEIEFMKLNDLTYVRFNDCQGLMPIPEI